MGTPLKEGTSLQRQVSESALSDDEWARYFVAYKTQFKEGAFLKIPKGLLARLGDYVLTLAMAFIVDQQLFFIKKYHVDRKGGWFFCTRETIHDNTGIGLTTISATMDVLENHFKLIESKYEGNPRRKFYRVNFTLYAGCIVEGVKILEEREHERKCKKHRSKQGS